ncbi:MAG TPA: pyruvate dehydrogenase (acetyl-transferring) E1 component subunit alpha [Flavobacterium sp.]|nr:pyruvate dehydrogenase (acetyl-transferring) E1 component subunit alpha [Flavobacterium sp.]
MAKDKRTEAKITKDTYLHWYEEMLLLRRFEEKAGMLYGQQKIRGFCHLYIGQEAIASGVVSAITNDDTVITAYRDHAIAMAKGISANAAMAELYGKITGCSKGKGGSMHFFSKEHNFFGGHGIVGAHIPLGAGIAFAEKYKGTKNVCVCLFGDGAVNQGALHETFNMARLWDLPVIFICENNGYAMGTSVKRSSSVIDLYKIGEAYKIHSEAVDGMVIEEIYESVSRAVEKARNGGGPSFLEIRTYRYKGHSMSDPAKYRSKEEVEEYKKKDPIEVVKQTILSKKYSTPDKLKEIDEKVKKEVEESVKFAENSAFPEPEELFKDVYRQQDYPFLTL